MKQTHRRKSSHNREASFHDEWALSQNQNRVRVRELFESPVAMENRFLLQLMEPLRGKRLLDIGAGLGESSVYFALRGARVTAMDLSPGMVDFAMGLARRHGVEIEGVVGNAEEFITNEQFDIVYAANLVHHLSNRGAFFRKIHEALVPGGYFSTIDPLRYSPIINVYRRMATKVRTEDERPLGFEDTALARRFFVNVRHREFWFLSQALFLKYFLIDRVHPNQERYWKRIFGETPAKLWWWYPLRAGDAILTHLPLLRRFAWNIVMWGQKAVRPD